MSPGRIRVSELEARLAVPATDGVFDEGDTGELAHSVRRYLGAAIAPGTPIARAARMTMRGHIKLGARWVPFRARETLAPHEGFVWTGRAAGLITGSDHYADGEGMLDWKLLGLITVAHAEGPDVARSAAARAAGEAVWVPTALLPRQGVQWEAIDEQRLIASFIVGDLDFTADYRIDDTGRLRAASFQRWGDPTNTGHFGWHRFGMNVTGYATVHGLTIPSAGSVGWHHGTDRWQEGEFFRYRITSLHPVAEGG